MERAKGIEPSALAWEARVLPLYDARAVANYKPFGGVKATGPCGSGNLYDRLVAIYFRALRLGTLPVHCAR